MVVQSPRSVSLSADPHAAPDLAVVLVGWNNKAYLEPCLASLYGGGLRSRFEVVVVDNGSTDGSQAMLRAKFPDVRLIHNDHNVGLGKASNQGIEATRGRYVLLLNNDTLVNAPSLDALVDFLDETPDAGAAGGQLLNPDGSFQAAGSRFPSLPEEFLIATRLGALLLPSYPDVPPRPGVRVVDWIGSACLLLRRAALDHVGGLDEAYFIYGDEADLQFRLRKAGWKVYLLPDVTTIHFGGRSMNRWGRRKMVYRGKLLFFRKHYGWLASSAFRLMMGGLSLAKLVIWLAAAMRPGWRTRAKQECASNLAVVRLCVNLK